MSEVLLVLTLIAAASTAGLLAFFLMRARSAERECARGALPGAGGRFSQMLTVQMGSNAEPSRMRNSRALHAAVDQQLEHMRKDRGREAARHAREAPVESFKQVPSASSWWHKGWARCRRSRPVGDLKRVLSNVKTRGVSAKRSSRRSSSR